MLARKMVGRRAKVARISCNFGRTDVRVLLLSDTHGTLNEQIAELSASCDIACHAGDIGNSDVLGRLRPRKSLYAVAGNNDTADKWPASQLAARDRLEDTRQIELPGGVLVLSHGHQLPAKDRHRRLRALYPNARAIVYGHSHKLAIDQESTPWVLNPGAAGRARTFGGPSCLILLIESGNWRVECRRFSL